MPLKSETQSAEHSLSLHISRSGDKSADRAGSVLRVKMAGRAPPAREAFQSSVLAGFLQHALEPVFHRNFAHRRQAIHEKHAVEVVDLMLQRPGE